MRPPTKPAPKPRKRSPPRQKGQPPKPPHRPPYEVTEKDRLTVRAMIAGGIPQERICPVIGVSSKTLRRHFKHELATASGEADAAIVASLHWMGTKGRNVAAAIWWTKIRMKWTERITVDGEGDLLGFAKLIEILEARRLKPGKDQDAAG